MTEQTVDVTGEELGTAYSRAVAVCEAIEEAVWTALDAGLTPAEVRFEVEAAIKTAEAA